MNVNASIAYCGRGIARPRYHANDHARDLLDMAPTMMEVVDARGLPTTLEDAGFVLVSHRSKVHDFTDRRAVDEVHRQEIIELVGGLTGASVVRVSSPGLLRFSERSKHSGALDNSRPARFAHVDISDSTSGGPSRRRPRTCLSRSATRAPSREPI